MARILVFILFTLGAPLCAIAYETDLFDDPMHTWVRHASDTYQTFDEDEEHPCNINDYDSANCYKGSNPNLDPVGRHCGFGPESQWSHSGLYGNQEDNQCSSSKAYMMHAGFDYDDPRHSHQQEGYSSGEDSDWHNPEDYIYPAASGKVVLIVKNGENDHGFGNTVIMIHWCAENCDYRTGMAQEIIGPFFTQYSHCADDPTKLVSEGDWVHPNTPICKVGGTATKNGSAKKHAWIDHLHFEVEKYLALENYCGTISPQYSFGYVDTRYYTMEDCGYYDPAEFIGRVRVFRNEEDIAMGGYGGEEPEDNSPLPKSCLGPGPLSAKCGVIFSRILLLGQ